MDNHAVIFVIAVALILFSGSITAGAYKLLAFASTHLPALRSPAGLFTAKFEIEYWKLAAICGVGWFFLGGATWQGCKLPNVPWPVIGGSAPFKTDKPSVLIVEESSDHKQYSPDQLNVIQSTDGKSVKVLVESKGGEFVVLDKDDGDKLTTAADWVREAFGVASKQTPPWMVGANARRGFSAPVTTEADAKSRAGGL